MGLGPGWGDMPEKWAVVLSCDYNGVGDGRRETVFCAAQLLGDGKGE